MLLRTPDADQSGFYVKRFFRSIQEKLCTPETEKSHFLKYFAQRPYGITGIFGSVSGKHAANRFMHFSLLRLPFSERILRLQEVVRAVNGTLPKYPIDSPNLVYANIQSQYEDD